MPCIMCPSEQVVGEAYCPACRWQTPVCAAHVPSHNAACNLCNGPIRFRGAQQPPVPSSQGGSPSKVPSSDPPSLTIQPSGGSAKPKLQKAAVDKKAFMRLSHRVLRNFVPATGRGQFNCAYNPWTGRLDITVRIFCHYLNQRLDKVNYTWSSQDKKLFEETAALSLKLWENKYVFWSRKPGWTELRAHPRFHLEFVADKKDAHVFITVPKMGSAYGAGGLAVCNSWVGLEQMKGDPLAQATGMIHCFGGHILDIGKLEGEKIARDERQRLTDAIERLELDSFRFTANSSTLPATARVALANFATQAKRRMPSTPLIPIVVNTSSSKSEREPMDLAYQRGLAIRTALESFHLPQPLVCIPLEPLSVPVGEGGLAGLIADARFEKTFEDTILYNIFAHEFGHMIGLPDEYDPMPKEGSEVDKDVAIVRFVGMAQAFKCGCPHLGKMTTSIMCKGSDFKAWHYVTVYQALVRLTNDALDMDDWELRPV